MSPPPAFRLDPTLAFRVILATGFLAMLAGAMPGHISSDSLIQLSQASHHVRDVASSFAPAVYGAVLGVFNDIIPGSGLYLVASGALLFGSLAALRPLRPIMSWFGPLAALAVVLSPALVIYQGVVWKDVLFANLSIAGFVLLARAAARWTHPGRPWITLLAVVVLMALASQVRQNGIISAGAAAMVMAWTARAGGWRAMLGWSLGLLLAILATSYLFGAAAQPQHGAPDNATRIGIRLLQHYDIIGASAHDPGLRLDEVRAVDPVAERVLRTRGVALYSPERIDYLDMDPGVGVALWRLPYAVVDAQWRDLITHHTGAYLAHRLDAFQQVFLTPQIDSCLPIFVGVDGPAPIAAELKMSRGMDPADHALYNYGSYFLDSPVFSHLSYAIAALVCGVLMLWRHEPQDVAMAGMMFAALAFAASFFVISIACDYRYLYFLDLAALAGVLYLAIDPPTRMFSRRRSR
jgi:hypothetical protein